MSAFTFTGRAGAPPTPATYAPGVPGPTGLVAQPLTAPYPGAETPGAAAYGAAVGTASRYPAAAPGGYHLSPLPLPAAHAPAAIAAAPGKAPLGAYQFAQVPAAPPASVVGPAISAAAYGTPAAPGAGNADAMRDYVANLRAQVASLKGEVEGGAASRRPSIPGLPAAPAGQQPKLAMGATPLAQGYPMPQQPAYSAAAPAAAALASTLRPGAPTPAAATPAARPPPAATPSAATAAGAAAAAAASVRPSGATFGAASARPGSAPSPGGTSPGARGGPTTGRASSVPRSGKPGGKATMSQRVVALRDELKAKEEEQQRLTEELAQVRQQLDATGGELNATKSMLLATDGGLRELTARHGELEAKHRETCRELASSTTHGETLEAQVAVFRRARELETQHDRLFTYFLRNSASPANLVRAASNGDVAPVPAHPPERLRNDPTGRLAMAAEADEGLSTAEPPLRVPHEVAQLVSKNFEELSSRADSQRSQIAQLHEVLRQRDEEIRRLTDNAKTLLASLDTLREQHRANESALLLETAEKAAATVRCDDALRMVLLLKAALRQTLEANEAMARDLDKQLTRIQVIDANEAMHSNRHDDAAHTIELRTQEIVQLRAVIATMDGNQALLSEENGALRVGAAKLQDQIASMRRRFDELSEDVSRRLQEQATRVTQIEDHTMKLATTAVQAQLAEQEASRAAQALIDRMRTESAEAQRVTNTAVADMRALPQVLLPLPARTAPVPLVATTLDSDGDHADGSASAAAASGAARRAGTPPRGGAGTKGDSATLPRHGPLSPAGRLGAALAEAASFGDVASDAHGRRSPVPAAASAAAMPSSSSSSVAAARGEDAQLDRLLRPLVAFPGDSSAGDAGNAGAEAAPMDAAEALARQIRATLAVDADARSRVDAAIQHANETIGRA
jgi:hypothetical protein